MKALRNWIRENEKSREIWAVHEYRQVSATAGDKMRDVIMVMADALESIENHYGVTPYKENVNPLSIATTAREKIREIVG